MMSLFLYYRKWRRHMNTVHLSAVPSQWVEDTHLMFLSPLPFSLSPHSLSIASCPTPPPPPSPPCSWPLPLSFSPCPLTSYVPLPFPFPVFPSTWSLTHYLPPTLLCMLGFFQGSPPKFSAMSVVPVDNLKPTPFSQPPMRIFPVPLYHYYSPPLSSPFFFSFSPFFSSLKGTHLKVFWSVDWLRDTPTVSRT